MIDRGLPRAGASVDDGTWVAGERGSAGSVGAGRRAQVRQRGRVVALVMILAAALALAGCEGSSTPPLSRPNLLVLSADSLRADRLASWKPGQGVRTPRLEGLARRGARFDNAWAVAPWTAPSMVSVFTGLYPPRHGVAYRDDTTPRALPTLPRLLAAAGYRVGNFSFFSGISYFRNLGLPAPARELRHDREAEAFRLWLDEAEARPAEWPFFAWIHLLHAHLPYGASGYRAREVRVTGSSGLEAAQLHGTLPVGSAVFERGDRHRLLELYDDDVVGLDRAVGSILGVLADRGLVEDTVIVFVADHGEELLEHGWVGHASTSLEAKLVPEILHIPLILAGPGIEPGTVSHALVQQVDIMPTVLPLLGVASPDDLDGRDLFARRALGDRLLARLGIGEQRSRSLVYFDSSPGGNLTPPERRTERFQGVGDGHCLLSSHTALGEERTTVDSVEGEACDAPALETALQRWREEQTRGRLAVLERYGGGGGIDEEAVAGFDESLEVLAPAPDVELRWGDCAGQLELEWQGTGSRYWVEYDVGDGPTRIRGSFEVEQHRLVFGPFPRGFWNDLASYSPFRFRVADPTSRVRSAWHSFVLVEAS